ncbi:MAG: hypothetical protein H6918_04120 [Sphingomonadaceae bacterium]|nr:hypothetical protein [Sphingomonadaceae bacterium]
MNNPVTKTPAHLWVVGVVSLLWNAIGANDYLQTRMRNMDYLGSMGFTDEAMAYIDGFPIWVDIAWGLGVWGAVAGSILLLLRRKQATIAFALSLIGAFLSNLYPYISNPPEIMQQPAAKIMPVVIIVIAILLLYYSRRQSANGVLR